LQHFAQCRTLPGSRLFPERTEKTLCSKISQLISFSDSRTEPENKVTIANQFEDILGFSHW